MSEIIFKRVAPPTAQSVYACIDYIIAHSTLTAERIGRKCLLKINAMSRELLPGRNTSPWVLDAVLKSLKERFPQTEFIVADNDVAGYAQFREACQNWGYNEIAKRYDVKIINLSDDELEPVDTGNPLCSILEFPKTVMSADSIINLPVLKTHVLSGITCCLKNHWGMLPRCRYQHHTQLPEVIAEINRQIKHTVYNIVDATICIEGSGPKTGRPKICSVIFGGADRVAVDAFAMKFMGMPFASSVHVGNSERAGVGLSNFTVTGDQFSPDPFEQPQSGSDLVSSLEKKLRALPVIGELLYSPSIAKVLGYIGTKYNEIVWFNLHGKKYIQQIIVPSPYYPEFKDLLP